MTRIVCFGELMLRLSPPGAERFFQSPALRTWFGGSEANVAVGLAHLGTPASYVTRRDAGRTAREWGPRDAGSLI